MSHDDPKYIVVEESELYHSHILNSPWPLNKSGAEKQIRSGKWNQNMIGFMNKHLS